MYLKIRAIKKQKQKVYFVYITASISKVLYVGYTDSLFKRIKQHKNGTYDNSFTKKYKTNKLVYWEECKTKQEALKRERKIKKYRREKKINLIERENPEWIDLFYIVIEMSKIRPLF